MAEGQKQAKILESGNLLNIYLPNILNFFCAFGFHEISFFFLNFPEAQKQQLINEAQGAAEAVIAAGQARAKSIELVRSSCLKNIGSIHISR